MKTIKFSHCYKKILDSHNEVVDCAKLLEVISIPIQHLSSTFIDYDTDGGLYPLPSAGNFLMLVFLKPGEASEITSANLFTTLRRATPEKEAYYRAAIGNLFVISVDPTLRTTAQKRKSYDCNDKTKQGTFSDHFPTPMEAAEDAIRKMNELIKEWETK